MQTFEPMSQASSRRFTRGHWDLRKEERRRLQTPIYFPDRRKAERRAFSYAAIEFRPPNRD